MNIVLIHPHIVVRDPDIYLSEPLGLISLATYLKQVFKDKVTVSILDLYAMEAGKPKRQGNMYVKGVNDKARIHVEIDKKKPDLIGIGCCFTGYFGEALEVAAVLKQFYPSVPIVMGGAHATLVAKEILQDNSYVDFIIRNEGEITLEQLVRALRGELTMESVDGLSFRAPDNSIVENPPRKFISDLDTLPIPDRGFVDMEHYKKYSGKLFYFAKKRPIATIMTSRGCPYECVFCCTKNIWRRKYRARGLEQVFKEIEILVSEYGIREICILDDQFIMKKDRIYEFCDYFIDRKLNISFSNVAGISAWLADDDNLLDKMRKAGFYKITIPIESGNQETIKFIRKPINLEKVSKLISKANRLGYWTGAFFIIGFPYETREQIMETVDFAYNSELDFAHFFVAQPYIGTELYDIFQKEKLVDDKIIPGTFIFHGWHDSLKMSADDLNKIQSMASGGWLKHKLIFYLKPKNFFNILFPKFKKPSDFRYSFSIFWMLINRKIKELLKSTSQEKAGEIVE
uniref:Magnesium-protoporphyrin IX monomethyl ester (Oxidative) cyclase n=1 Tax=Candidatus Kentrum sp. MB TaxID=2138164 RepID=A0A451BE17_9GAMM|nr:MAG: magnesium-protoporphyrin IX monomethyl ester (oxidative) cyclase [Candidatus Kentron sp. MB]VFK33965.1 MAG: magnesium-protoporphyrin IX monomethyl ester (oxidative) cyclase [Candidatus Kentron sp. MB]VFK76528.1 MAG: magnesium-protoporphyrin IX monomethyl ester (oxidative) cyclase [Candidatus Kentron sp. MB]